MNDLLIRGIVSERNHLIQNQFNKIIPCRKRESSIERKTLKITSRTDSSNVGNTIIYTNINNANNITKKSIMNATQIINNNANKLNNDNINCPKSEKTNNIINIQKNNDTNRNISNIFLNNEKAKSYNRHSSSKKIKIGTIIYKNKSNQIPNNSIIQIEGNKREIHKKLNNLDNNNLNTDINNDKDYKNNSQSFIEEIKYKNNYKRNTDGIIHLDNNKKIYNEELKKIKDKEKANKVKAKLIKDKVKNDFNRTINLKSNELHKNNSKNDFGNIILQSNHLNNNNNINSINNFESLLKKRKNIDINTEYQTNPVNDTFSNRNNIINNLYNTTSKVKVKTNNLITNIEMEKDKEFLHLTENCIKKTKSKAKIKLENKKDPEIEVRIIEPKRVDNVIFNNKRTQIPSKNIKSKNNEINKNTNGENKLINNNNINEKIKTKNSCVKVKKTQNQNEQINRNNTYNNNESSFFTTNINSSNIDENNNEHMPMHNLGNYYFVNNAHNNENINNYNINNEVNNKENKEFNNTSYKINNVKVFKSNSNTNKNILFQNFNFFNENKTFNNILTTNNCSSCNTGNTTNNILNQNNNLYNNINNKNKIENSNIEITNRKIETQNTKELENKEELILIELDDEKNPMDTDEKLNNEEKKYEIIKCDSLNKKNTEEIKEKGKEKEKDISLDKSTSLKALPIQDEDFIEKDDEFIKLLEQPSSRDNKKNCGYNNNHQTNEEDESDIIIQNSDFSIINDYSKYNYNINNKNIYQNANVYMNYNNSNKNNVNHGNNQNINLENITMKDTSIMSNIGIKGCKSITQAGKERTGHRKKNQDNYIIEKNLNNILGFNLFAILDGHGENGHIISQLASKYLIKKFTNISNKFNDNEALYYFLKQSYFQKVIDIFLETDQGIINQKNIDTSMSGSTCVLVIQLGDHLICSNIGDSRAILIYEENDENKIFELSHDSKPELPEEEKRINKLGGRVDKITDENGEKTGPYRVYMKNGDQPGLAMSRSFGDKKAKSCGVIPYPDIIEYNLNNNDSKYMVICSDGVWEFLSNEEVMDIGNKYYAENNMNGFCKELLKKSTELWENEENYMDDITIVTVFF